MSYADTAGHASVMDRVYRGQRHIYDLTRKYYLLGRDDLIKDLKPEPGAHVLELGCGTGRNLIVAARRYPDVMFYGIDASEEMLKTARTAIHRAGLGDRIHLAHGFAESVDPKQVFAFQQDFDVVFFSYSLSMIPDWKGAIHHAFSLLKPGGRLLCVDFGNQQRLPRWFRRLLFAWLEKFHVTPRLDLPSTLAEAAAQVRATPHVQWLYRNYACLAQAEKARN